MKIYKIKQVLKNIGQSKIGGEEGLAQNKSALFEFIERYPVRKIEVGRQGIMGGGFLKLTFKPMPIIVGAIIAALLAGGGTAYASQSSLPGDALYPVKLMAEDVETAIAWNPEKKVKLETKFAGRRLEEIKELQEKIKNKNGEIAPEVVEKAMGRAEKRLKKAEAQIAEMEEGRLKEKALGAASHLEEALQDHEQILADLAGDVPDEVEQILLRAQEKAALHSERALGVILRLEKRDDLKDKIREKAKEEVGKIMGAEERAEGKLGALENKLEAVENYLENLKEQGRDVTGYEVKLAEAKAKLAEAKKLLEEDKYLAAFQAANEVMKMLMQAKAVLRPIFVPKPLPVENQILTPSPLPIKSTILPESDGGVGESSESAAPLPVEIEPAQSETSIY